MSSAQFSTEARVFFNPPLKSSIEQLRRENSERVFVHQRIPERMRESVRPKTPQGESPTEKKKTERILLKKKKNPAIERESVGGEGQNVENSPAS